ncbi:MAG: site-2 protease family protein [Chromatiales bacterium]|nr:site-2 protease family protein [Chromatiales bacterium]
MTGGVRLGRIAGIEVVADWSLLIIFTLISSLLAVGVFPTWHPDWPARLCWAVAIAAATLFFLSVLLHELSHAVVGRMNGIQVPRITLFIFGGMAHMENEPPDWKAEFFMAAVGPVTSCVIGLACLWLAAALAGPLEFDPADPAAFLATLSPVATLLFWLGPVNILLAVFNLVPGFPLDGGRVLRALLWGVTGSLRLATRWASAAGQAFGWLLIGTGVAMLLGFSVPLFGSGLVGGLWLMLIGWFLQNAATGSYRQLLVSKALENIPVSQLMQTQLTRVPPDFPVQRLLHEHLMASGQRVFPVEADGNFLGMVCLSDLGKMSTETDPALTVARIMTPREQLSCVGPGAHAADALATLARRNVNQLPVVERDRLLGLLRREEVLKWLALRGDLA